MIVAAIAAIAQQQQLLRLRRLPQQRQSRCGGSSCRDCGCVAMTWEVCKSPDQHCSTRDETGSETAVRQLLQQLQLQQQQQPPLTRIFFDQWIATRICAGPMRCGRSRPLLGVASLCAMPSPQTAPTRRPTSTGSPSRRLGLVQSARTGRPGRGWLRRTDLARRNCLNACLACRKSGQLYQM